MDCWRCTSTIDSARIFYLPEQSLIFKEMYVILVDGLRKNPELSTRMKIRGVACDSTTVCEKCGESWCDGESSCPSNISIEHVDEHTSEYMQSVNAHCKSYPSHGWYIISELEDTFYHYLKMGFYPAIKKADGRRQMEEGRWKKADGRPQRRNISSSTQ